jgi:hypothetical protein
MGRFKTRKPKHRAAEPFAAADSDAPRLTGWSLSQAFGLATVLGYHRRAAEFNRWAARARQEREKVNTRKMTSTIHVTIVVLFLSACGMLPPTLELTSTPELTPTSEPTSIPGVMSDCFISFQVAAWQDLNGDGLWDVSEPPLEGVKFQLQGIFAEKWDPEPSSKGDGWFSILIWSPGDCIEQEYTITVVPPESYEATTPTAVTFSDSLPFEAQFGFRAASK